MIPNINQIKDLLVQKGLKVTPQRMAILDAIYSLNNHPSAEMIMEYVKDVHPGISTATVYKVLDALIEKQLIKRVKTEKDIMRYDAVLDSHHHLYCSDTEEIKDYKNEELDEILNAYFKENGIKGFRVEEIKLQINGKFLRSTNEKQ